MDDNTQEKDDRKDPIVIARLVPEGRYAHNSFNFLPSSVLHSVKPFADLPRTIAAAAEEKLNS